MHTGSRTTRLRALDTVKRAIAGLGLFLVLAGLTPAVAAAAEPRPLAVAAQAAPAQPAAPLPLADPTPTQSPKPPELTPPPGFQMPDRKVIIGGIAIVLFVIVYYGRKIRAQRKKDGGGGA